ncbi:hypothetical protein [Xanthomonas arboricola]|uniref:hypothetical protein n=1 Tax=Xanthomonas arboricola TaxID=56448 RepID=UPI00160E9EA3|nr:hypothetical protein [Xanthomonas arboricola]
MAIRSRACNKQAQPDEHGCQRLEQITESTGHSLDSHGCRRQRRFDGIGHVHTSTSTEPDAQALQDTAGQQKSRPMAGSSSRAETLAAVGFRWWAVQGSNL